MCGKLFRLEILKMICIVNSWGNAHIRQKKRSILNDDKWEIFKGEKTSNFFFFFVHQFTLNKLIPHFIYLMISYTDKNIGDKNIRLFHHQQTAWFGQ